ncbi:hypothetical protein HJC23_013840 [Cyclotella cryptica]|uniref:2Fe-2S ferredoxin-type domain-containing protein n=1 Tax=Cyclotella cryptica TaxID=29204 RepID=A0ABD3PEK9_9STRA|eukprot:CCRYP_016314-RA/>CCRYP_016314-RA protein AED:0.05 eAED:0.05 QI:62/1/1/1/0/0/2/366/310
MISSRLFFAFSISLHLCNAFVSTRAFSYAHTFTLQLHFPASILHGRGQPHLIPRTQSLLLHENPSSDTNSGTDDGSIDISTDPRLRRVRLSRATGIEWGTDLSFSFVYVRALEPAGDASLSGEVKVGDQICELRSVLDDGDVGEATNLIGAGFDVVMNAFASLNKNVRNVDIVFFRGSKEELKALCTGGSKSNESDDITITVVQNKGAKDEAVRKIQAKAGCNIRKILTENGINVYQSVTRWTNCKGKQLCGTCIVNIADGGSSTNRKSLDEASTLRENPESYRLSCVAFAYGDVTVETFPPIEAAQWTR